MNQYEIRYSMKGMPTNYVGRSFKWAIDEKSALKHLLKKAPKKNGFCVFKRGAIGKIISIKQLELE
tara:strand:+ start:309 stop:506 length:198 start_codon:yes stop_codon:yes gene_type:complete